MPVNFYNIFSPCIILYPFSPTLASISQNNVANTFVYRLYMLLYYIVVEGALIAQLYMYVFIYDMHWNIINKPSLLFTYCLFITILLLQSMKVAKKNKMKRLIDEFNEMEHVEINNEKYKIYNAVFAVVLLVNHVGCTIINVFNSEATALFLLSVTCISLTGDAEILSLTSYVSIFIIKMDHYILRLEEVLKEGELERKDFYVRFRQLLRVVKRINNIWQAQIFAILCFELYFTTRNGVKIFVSKKTTLDVISVFSTISKYAMTLRHALIYIQLGWLGQAVAERFDHIAQLSSTIHDLDLGEEMNHETWKITRLAAICPGRLVAGWITLDGQLPLSAISAVISAVIIMLQFGLAIY